MKIIQDGDKKAVSIIAKKKIPENTMYRVSGFVYPYSENGIYLLRNTLSGQTVTLTESEWNAFNVLIKEPKDYSYINENGLTELSRLRFIVESDYIEEERYKQVLEILDIMKPKKTGLKTYTILPTTDCNARCVYCYEQGIEALTMSKETADRLIDYICETRCDDEIILSWFGGEPLVAHETISYICRNLKDRGVPFKSKMVTNASLMTSEMAHQAVTLWNLKKVQISLDGMPSDYEERKRYYLPERYNHYTVIRSIHYLADKGIDISLRVNFDRDNISGIKRYLDFLKAEFVGSKRVYVYLSMLFQEKHGEKCIELYREMFELNKYMKKIGLNQGIKNKTNIKINYCMADSMDSSILIDPQGNFYNCEHMPEGKSWGNIFDGCTDTELFEKLKAPSVPDEKCISCAFLPCCTPFYKTGCVGWFEKCREYMEMRTEYSLGSIADFLNEDQH